VKILRLQEARAKAGLSQRAVAKELGITDAAVCLWETGKTMPRAALLPRLAALYNCTVDELLREDGTGADRNENRKETT